MGILFGTRPKLESISNLDDLEAHGLSQVNITENSLKVFDDIQVPLQKIRRDIIADQDPVDLDFIVDNS